MKELMHQLLVCLELYGVFCALDIVTLVLALRRAIVGRGASGIPLVTLIFYVVLLLAVRINIPLSIKLLAILIASAIHFGLLMIPSLVGGFIDRRNGLNNDVTHRLRARFRRRSPDSKVH